MRGGNVPWKIHKYWRLTKLFYVIRLLLLRTPQTFCLTPKILGEQVFKFFKGKPQKNTLTNKTLGSDMYKNMSVEDKIQFTEWN